MKETKMYISNLPKSCSECPCTHEDFAECNWCQAFDNELLTFIPDEIYSKERLENCPLHLLKTHDRELVKEVCEKIREYLRTQVIYCGGKATELDIMIANAGNQVLEDVKQFLDQIQKEYEK